MINEAVLEYLEDSVLVTVNDSCIVHSKSNISLLNVPSMEWRKTLNYPMVNDPISNTGEGTHPEIARVDRFLSLSLLY